VGLALAGIALTGTIHMRDDVRDSTRFTADAKILHHETEDRLDYLERPEAVVQIAQATRAVEDVRKAVRISGENATEIALIKVEQGHQRDTLKRIEGLVQNLVDRPTASTSSPGG
jgi:hypothetical protein